MQRWARLHARVGDADGAARFDAVEEELLHRVVVERAVDVDGPDGPLKLTPRSVSSCSVSSLPTCRDLGSVASSSLHARAHALAVVSLQQLSREMWQQEVTDQASKAVLYSTLCLLQCCVAVLLIRLRMSSAHDSAASPRQHALERNAGSRQQRSRRRTGAASVAT